MAVDHVDQTIVPKEPAVVSVGEPAPTTTNPNTARTESPHLKRSGTGTVPALP